MVFPSGHDRSAGDGDGRPIWFFQTVTSIIIIIIIIIIVIVITIIIILHHHHHDSAPARGDGRPIWFSQNSHRDAGSSHHYYVPLSQAGNFFGNHHNHHYCRHHDYHHNRHYRRHQDCQCIIVFSVPLILSLLILPQLWISENENSRMMLDRSHSFFLFVPL